MGDNEKKTVQALPKKVRALYGVGDFGFTLMSNIETFFWNDFLVNLAGFAPTIAALIMTIASTVDACLSWCYGAILNAVKPKKWGRYRSWLIMLPWVVPILFAFQFLSLSSNMTVSAVIIVAAAIISHFIWNLPWTANVTLISVMSKNADQRLQLASSRSTWNNAVGVFFSYFGGPFAAVLAGIIGEKNKYAAVAFVLGVIMVIGYYVHFVISKGLEEIEAPVAAVKKERKNKISFKDMLLVFAKAPSLIFLILADLPRYMVRFVVSGAAVYFFRDVIGSPATMTIYLLISSLAAVFGSFLAGIIAKKVSSRTMYLGSLIAMAVLFFLAYLCYSQVWVVIILISIAQIFFGCTYAAAPALFGDVAVYAQWKTGKDSRGWIMGLGTVPLKVAIIMKGIFMNACLAAVGYVSQAMANANPSLTSQIYNVATASEQTKRTIAMPFTLIPALALVVGILLFLFGYRLSKAKVTQYQAEIDARAASAE